MKKLLISIIHLYQKFPFSSHNQCWFIPTCSNYAEEAILTYGSIKGSYLEERRILRCHPFCSSGYDPVRLKEEKHEKN